METQKLHRGRLIDHVQIVSKDLAASKKFYSAVLEVLGVPIGGSEAEYFWYDELFVSSTKIFPDATEPTGPMHLAFQAKDEAQVLAFHAAGLKAGGRDDGAPGLRNYHPGYFAAFLVDPDGNYIEAVYHGAAKRSAPSVTLEW